jgi:hypothetical protein
MALGGGSQHFHRHGPIFTAMARFSPSQSDFQRYSHIFTVPDFHRHGPAPAFALAYAHM